MRLRRGAPSRSAPNLTEARYRRDHSHACCVQAPSGAVQIPQLSLQQTCPASHVALPHCGPALSLARGMQTPCPSCDSQRESVAHVIAAHGCVPPTHVPTGGHGARTHCTVFTSQKPSPQSTPAHGSVASEATGEPAGAGSAAAGNVASRARSDAGVDTESVEEDGVGGALGFSLHAPTKHAMPTHT